MFISDGNQLQIPVKSRPWLFAEEFQALVVSPPPPAIKGAGWISQRAIITSGDVRARRCVGPAVLDDQAGLQGYRPNYQTPLKTHTHTHTFTSFHPRSPRPLCGVWHSDVTGEFKVS